MNLTLSEIRSALGASCDLDQGTAKLVPPHVRTDSRLVGKDDLFFCIEGETFDGHSFAAEAIRRGASAVVAHRPVEFPKGMEAPVFPVEDTIRGLGRLAAFWRTRTQARVVGVTGTAGKTTVKELIARILSEDGEVAKNHLNLNNQIGLPQSMLSASGREAYWVFEAGISHAHDMDELGAILKPDLAIVVNVGQAHLSGLGDVAGVADYKTRLLNYLAPGGEALVSADYPELLEASAATVAGRDGKVRYFSRAGNQADFSAAYLGPGEQGQGRFSIVLGGKVMEAESVLRGGFAAENIAVAAGAASMLGLGQAEIARGMRGFTVPEQRFQVREIKQWTVVDDSYNANPLSMAGILETMPEMAAGRPLVLVLGAMGELGEASARAHEELGRRVAATGALAVFWHGDFSEQVSQGLRDGGFKGAWSRVETPEGLVFRFRDLEIDTGVVLFKGSRANGLEVYAESLLKELQG